MEKIDTILFVTDNNHVNEVNVDSRMHSGGLHAPAWGSKTGYLDSYGPDIYSQMAFGNVMQRAINDPSNGITCEVSDFGPWVSVRVTAHNTVSGRSATKVFMVVFQAKTKGIVMSTSNKWRTIDGYQQAISYIRSASSALKNNLSSAL